MELGWIGNDIPLRKRSVYSNVSQNILYISDMHEEKKIANPS
jgi:hypothetical protein